mgnify:CR=1 FL=1
MSNELGPVLSTPLILVGLYGLWLSRRSPTLMPQPQTTSAATRESA